MDTKEKLHVYIRWLIRRDYPEVLSIDKQSFSNSYSEDEILKQMRCRNVIGMVSEHIEVITGFFIYELHKTFLEVTRFAVHPDYRGQGVGRTMVDKLVGKLSHQRRNQILIRVRESNMDAQFFFCDMGFLATKVERGYWEDTGEDAYLMKYELPESE